MTLFMTVTEAATETCFETGNIITGEILKKKKEECEEKRNPLVHLGFWLWGGV